MTLFTPRNPVQVTEELSRWFGGRVPDNHVINMQTADCLLAERLAGGGDTLTDSFTAMTRSVVIQCDLGALLCKSSEFAPFATVLGVEVELADKFGIVVTTLY